MKEEHDRVLKWPLSASVQVPIAAQFSKIEFANLPEDKVILIEHMNLTTYTFFCLFNKCYGWAEYAPFFLPIMLFRYAQNCTENDA